jgi:protein-S-isoprenylcysteine O-methyltransferase Ste14
VRRVRRIGRRIVDFATLVAIPLLLIVGVGDLTSGELEGGGLEVAIAAIAALTAWNARSRAKAAAATHTTGVRPWEALLAFVLFLVVGTVSVLNAVNDEGPRATTDAFGAVLLFVLAGASLWVRRRARASRVVESPQ